MSETPPRRRRVVPVAESASTVPILDVPTALRGDSASLPPAPKAKSGPSVAGMSAFQKLAMTAAKKSKDRLQFTARAAASFHLGLPSPSLALSYGLGSNVIPLSRFIHLVGEEASFKTAFMIDLIRLMLELAESDPEVPLISESILYCENENKLASDYIWSILEHRDHYEGIFRLDETKTADEWMMAMVTKVKEWEKLFGPTDVGDDADAVGWCTPLVLAVDSLVGTAPAGVIDSILKKGDIDLGYPLLAKKLTALSQMLPQMIGNRPMLFMATNHLKKFTDPQSNILVEKVPGGQAVKHMESLEFRFARGKTIQHESLPGAEVMIKFHKNCLGESRRRISVPIRWTYDYDTGEKRQWTMWDWPVASIALLMAIQDKQPKLWTQIESVLDLGIAGDGRVYSDALGIPKSDRLTKHEAGIALEQNSAVMDALLPIMGIKQGRFYKPGMNFAVERLRENAPFDSMAARSYRVPAANDLSKFLASNEDPTLGRVSGFELDGHAVEG